MDIPKIILEIINNRLSILDENENKDIRYYEDYESIEQAYLEGYNNGGVAELYWLKIQIEYLLK